MAELISVIVPNRNGEATIRQCLDAAFASRYENFEVIVVDDCSTDGSVEIIKEFPCTLIQLDRKSGASRARNIGVNYCKGNILFFTDADCLLQEDTLSVVVETLGATGQDVVLGGTYTVKPVDGSFFSRFQSVFINYFETVNSGNPDYIATHAMGLQTSAFTQSEGFAEHFLPVLEDVEYSHRMRGKGYRLLIRPDIQVRHVFNFTLWASLDNGFRKSMYWIIYSLHNRDLLADSGTASRALKLNVANLFFAALVLVLIPVTGKPSLAIAIVLLTAVNLRANYGLLRAFYDAGGARFSIGATAYYLLLYPLAVGAGGLSGVLGYYRYAQRLKKAG